MSLKRERQFRSASASKSVQAGRYPDRSGKSGGQQDQMTRRDILVRRAAALAILSCVLVALADIVSWVLFVEDYNPINKTISALAVGAGSWLLDLGLWTFAGGCVALGLGMFRRRLGNWTWLLAAIAVLLLGPVIGVIAFFNEYAGQQNAGANIHLNAVYSLGVLVALAAIFVVPGLRVLDRRLARRGLIFGVAWVILAPLFFVVPGGWSGGYERGLALMLLGWITAMSFLLLRRA